MAYYKSEKDLFRGNPKVTWLEEVSLVNLDYVDNDHNFHLFTDLIWLLDVSLFQDTLSLSKRPGLDTALDPPPAKFFGPAKQIYLPQSFQNFTVQTGRDLNRVLYALILQLPLSKLYPNFTEAELKVPAERRESVPLMQAYPTLKERLVFHHDIITDKKTDLVCTARLTVGPKVTNGGHERVCRRLRSKGWEAFGVDMPEMRHMGQAFFAQPAKRVVLLQRHISRKIVNVEAVEKGLRLAFEKFGIEVEVVTTEVLGTAEEYVRTFSRAGVMIAPHGSQNMGQIWMPRHAALVEVMPVGYTDYAIRLLAEKCQIWYYELQSMLASKSKEFYKEHCGKKEPHLLDPCSAVKSEDIMVNVTKLVGVVRIALERIGYVTEPWMDFVRYG